MSEEVEYGAITFEEKHLISIMLFLCINGSCRKIDIYDNVTSNPRVPDKLNRLEAMGLITQDKSAGSKSVTVSLTDKGRQIADRLVELDRLVKS